MKVKLRKKGMSLLEIIIAIALLGIIAVILLNAFVQGFSTIFSMGNKTRAMATAQDIIDVACQSGDPSTLSGVSTEASDQVDLYQYEESIPHKYWISSQDIGTVLYDKVTVVVFYQRGRSYVELTSIIP